MTSLASILNPLNVPIKAPNLINQQETKTHTQNASKILKNSFSINNQFKEIKLSFDEVERELGEFKEVVGIRRKKENALTFSCAISGGNSAGSSSMIDATKQIGKVVLQRNSKIMFHFSNGGPEIIDTLEVYCATNARDNTEKKESYQIKKVEFCIKSNAIVSSKLKIPKEWVYSKEKQIHFHFILTSGIKKYKSSAPFVILSKTKKNESNAKRKEREFVDLTEEPELKQKKKNHPEFGMLRLDNSLN